MKSLRLLILPLAATIVTAAYTIEWSTIDSGGGQSAGGSYTVAGTIGQTDTTRLSGGTYAITGGFWALPELLQVPGGPVLAISTAPGAAVLTWPASAAGWRLETSTTLTGWTPVTATPVTAGDLLQVTQPLVTAGTRRYYRLALP